MRLDRRCGIKSSNCSTVCSDSMKAVVPWQTPPSSTALLDVESHLAAATHTCTLAVHELVALVQAAKQVGNHGRLQHVTNCSASVMTIMSIFGHPPLHHLLQTCLVISFKDIQSLFSAEYRRISMSPCKGRRAQNVAAWQEEYPSRVKDVLFEMWGSMDEPAQVRRELAQSAHAQKQSAPVQETREP